jgi:probable phosphoglycerate mutase
VAAYIVEADGGSRGNPGEAAGGAVVINRESGEVVVEIGVFIGHATNNVAEYHGMLAAIEYLNDVDPHAVIHVRMDSKLVVEQMSGRWKIKHPDMQVLATRARTIIGSRPVTFEWIPREQNSRADAAANKSMDMRSSFRA